MPRSATKSSTTRWWSLGTAILCATLAYQAHADSNSVALVTQITGVTTPQLLVHREIAPGTRIDLAPGTYISIYHYSSCTIVALTGGTATVTEQGIEAKASNIASRKPAPCARIHR